jgi:hypothetical protein
MPYAPLRSMSLHALCPNTHHVPTCSMPLHDPCFYMPHAPKCSMLLYAPSPCPFMPYALTGTMSQHTPCPLTLQAPISSMLLYALCPFMFNCRTHSMALTAPLHPNAPHNCMPQLFLLDLDKGFWVSVRNKQRGVWSQDKQVQYCSSTINFVNEREEMAQNKIEPKNCDLKIFDSLPWNLATDVNGTLW